MSQQKAEYSRSNSDQLPGVSVDTALEMGLNRPKIDSFKVGSSNCFNLHAKIKVQIYKNGEAKAFPSVSYGEISDEEGKKRGRKEGELEQSGLTSYSKLCIRICAQQFQEQVEDYKRVKAINGRSYNSFISLTFRRILPKDDKHAKDMLRAMLERMIRHKGRRFAYVWVAEVQEGKMIKDQNGNLFESYRMKHGQRALHFHILTPECFDKHWIDHHWNEVVSNHYVQHKQVGVLDAKEWMEETTRAIEYDYRLDRFKSGATSRRPKRPKKAWLNLQPNVIPVNQASAYMSKYMSKEDGKIKGHMWGMSDIARKLTIPDEIERPVVHVQVATNFIKELSRNMELDNCTNLNKVKAAKAKGKDPPVEKDVIFTWTDYEDRPGIWTNNGKKLEEWYYKLINKHDLYETESQKQYICQDHDGPSHKRANQASPGVTEKVVY